MYNLTDFYAILNDIAPIELSLKSIEKGDYDNSGILVKQTEKVNKALFCLDLTESAVNRAIRLKCDTIVTHHPAIYTPVKSLDIGGENKALLKAISKGLNIISMHLNLDFATCGIDANLAKTLGAKSYKILDYVVDGFGYGREFSIQETTLSNYANFVKNALKTKKVIAYGNKNTKIKSVASFCGAGSPVALKMVKGGLTNADLIVSADIPHHILLELLELNKCVLVLTHYSAEIVGFKDFANQVKERVKGGVEIIYFEDKRFM